MAPLSETAKRQLLWSKTAVEIKRGLEFARWFTFLFSILGALLATIASQLDQPQPRLYVSIAGAVSLAIMSFLASRLLTGTQVTNWVRARAASEALKREAFKYMARVIPYNNPATRDALLNEERNRIENDVDDLIGIQVSDHEPGPLPRENLTRDEYVDRRGRQQIEYYLDNAEACRQKAKILRSCELILALAATVITAVVGVAGKEVFGLKFDFVAITAVITTIAGVILAHIEASRYDFLITTYRATARRLTNELVPVGNPNAMSAEEWSAFVQRCESIISDENASWVAKWSKSPQ